MKKEFVTYPLALRMKALGFDEPCLKSYTKDGDFVTKMWQEVECDAPLFQQAFRWFDYSTEFSGFIVPSPEEGLFTWWIQNYIEPQLSYESKESYLTREEAELACIEKLIEIVESKSE